MVYIILLLINKFLYFFIKSGVNSPDFFLYIVYKNMNLQNQRVLFMAGFPRAGSTLLMNIMAQNPIFYPTSTSGVINEFIRVRDNWRSNEIFNSANEKEIYPRIKTLLKGILYGFYEKEIMRGIIPIDKNRMWAAHIDLLEEILNTHIKIIYPVRNVIDCSISFEKVHRKSLANFHSGNEDQIKDKTVVGRAENKLQNNAVLGMSILLFDELLNRGFNDRIVFIPFDNLIQYPNESMLYIHKELGIKPFRYNFDNIKQVTVEYDTIHGYSPDALHAIKEGKIDKNIKTDRSIFPDFFIKDLEEKYGWIDQIIKDNNILTKL